MNCEPLGQRLGVAHAARAGRGRAPPSGRATCRWRSAFSASSRRPASASVRFSRMQVRTSSSAPARRARVAHAVGGHRARPSASARSSSAWLAASCAPPAVALDVDRHAGARPKSAQQARQPVGVGRAPSVSTPGSATRPVRTPPRARRSRSAPLPLGTPAFMSRDQPAEVPVAGAALDQHRQAAAAGERQLRAHERADARGLRGLEEARRAGHAVAIDQRHRRQAELGGALHQLLGQRAPRRNEKAEDGVELDGHRGC